jgi:hypothetical protein
MDDQFGTHKVKSRIGQESRTPLIGGSGARNDGKRPGQRRDSRPDTHHDSQELRGYFLEKDPATGTSPTAYFTLWEPEGETPSGHPTGSVSTHAV